MSAQVLLLAVALPTALHRPLPALVRHQHPLPTLARCAAPAVLSAAVPDASPPQDASAAAPPDASPPQYFSAPLVAFIGALTLGLATGASLLKLPALKLADLGASPCLPTPCLLAMRASFAAIIGASLSSSLRDKDPVQFNLITYAGTRLPPRAVGFRGLERLTTYTVQCWALQLVYFTVATAASALQLAGVHGVPVGLARAVHVLYEIVVQTAILVTCCVTFVLLPTRIRRGDWAGARRMLGRRPQLMHNANLAFAASELLFNSLPMLPLHFTFGALFGVQYVLLSWWWLKRTGIVYYPFLDPTLPAPRAIAFHFALLAVIAAFFGLGAGVDKVASLLPFVVRAPLLYAGACSLMWTNFIRGRPGELAAQAEGGTE
eukprot:Transcript_864.p1 GENE.Transcript_864~~Transcript_864.p1  ORF type:complete len:393 (-),score=138.36 Transcript_864:29-1159(-)